MVVLATASEAQQPPFSSEVREISGPTTIELVDGREVELQGLSLPAEVVLPDGSATALESFLAARLVGERVWITVDAAASDGLVGMVRREQGGVSVNEEALRAGLAVLRCATPEVADLERLLAAARDAQAEGNGWFAGRAAPRARAPYLNGAVVGLHELDPRRTYHQRIDELADAGFAHVSLLFSGFLDDVTASEVRRDRPRCVPDERLIETIEHAKERGMTVMLLPIVLLREAADSDWRGTIRPADEPAFWLSYDAFLGHYLDIAEATGVDLFSLGSELGSMESRTPAWNRLIANARGRFRGLLTYSANWDHVHVPRFFGKLDLVGMTAYFSLSDQRDPSRDRLVAGWRRIAARLERSVGMIGKPVIFTELGYASQDGANTNPWNYVMNPGEVDLQEQADCFAAFLAVVGEMTFLRGAYWYDYFGAGGAEDDSYSPRGKPAFGEWRRWAAYRPID